MKRLVYILLMFFVVMGLNWQVTHATDESAIGLYEGRVVDPCPGGTATGLCSTATSLITRLGDRIHTTIAFVASVISIIMIIYSGILYTTSLGDEAKSTRAKKTLLYASIAIVVLISSILIQQASINQASNAPTAAQLQDPTS